MQLITASDSARRGLIGRAVGGRVRGGFGSCGSSIRSGSFTSQRRSGVAAFGHDHHQLRRQQLPERRMMRRLESTASDADPAQRQQPSAVSCSFHFFSCRLFWPPSAFSTTARMRPPRQRSGFRIRLLERADPNPACCALLSRGSGVGRDRRSAALGQVSSSDSRCRHADVAEGGEQHNSAQRSCTELLRQGSVRREAHPVAHDC